MDPGGFIPPGHLIDLIAPLDTIGRRPGQVHPKGMSHHLAKCTGTIKTKGPLIPEQRVSTVAAGELGMVTSLEAHVGTSPAHRWQVMTTVSLSAPNTIRHLTAGTADRILTA